MINDAEELVPSLLDKCKYVIHIGALDQALKHGLILKKVHQVIEFDQPAWLKPYIDVNTEHRAKLRMTFRKISTSS